MSASRRRDRPGTASTIRIVVAIPFEGGVVFAADGSSRLVKTPWGLLSAVGETPGGSPASAYLERAAAGFARRPPLDVGEVWAELARLSSPDSEGPYAARRRARRGTACAEDGLVVVFSHEVDPSVARSSTSGDAAATAARGSGGSSRGSGGWLGAPVSLYRCAVGGAAPGPVGSRWGVVAAAALEGGPAAAELQRGGRLYLQGALDRGVDLVTRLRLAQETVVWVVREAAGGWGAGDEPPRDLEVVVGVHEAGHSYSVDRIGATGLSMPPV